ncbi:SRPBCC domain-containing protein [Sphaerisporangium flaviroseum]|uniref:SRPBCC domain-containing protein n=1 Tax=Sphaerisporangium flaviroseum TaxID=509199 RepID=A0ABP7IKY2_9ACTN
MPHKFELRKEVTLKATPEQVWDAITTGPGIDSWFMRRSKIKPREGGAAQQYVGHFPAEATVTAWEPSRRLAFRSNDNPDGSFMAIEYLIEGRGHGSTVLRLVQSGVLGDDWEAEYDAMNQGWDIYLHTLGQYLSYFPGRFAVVVFAARHKGGGEPVWPVLMRGLGLTEPIAQGDKVRLTPKGLDPIEGIADFVRPGFLGVRNSDGLYRFVHGINDTLVLGHHLFAEADPKKTERAWEKWLTQLFA